MHTESCMWAQSWKRNCTYLLYYLYISVMCTMHTTIKVSCLTCGSHCCSFEKLFYQPWDPPGGWQPYPEQWPLRQDGHWTIVRGGSSWEQFSTIYKIMHSAECMVKRTFPPPFVESHLNFLTLAFYNAQNEKRGSINSAIRILFTPALSCNIEAWPHQMEMLR